MEDATIVTVKRTGSEMMRRGGRLKVYIDGDLVGRLDYRENVDVEVEPGYHRMVIKDWTTGWNKSKVVDFNIEAGETAYFETGSMTRNALVWAGLLLLANFFNHIASPFLPNSAVSAIFLAGVVIPTIWIFIPGNLLYLTEVEDPESEVGSWGQDEIKTQQRSARSMGGRLPYAGRRYG